jgi:hypothetical protein
MKLTSDNVKELLDLCILRDFDVEAEPDKEYIPADGITLDLQFDVQKSI